MLYLASIVTSIGVLTLLEYFYQAEKGQGLRGKLRNMFYMGIYLLCGTLLTLLVIITVNPLPKDSLISSPIPSALGILGSLLLIDFIFYWYHRAQHTFPFLWAIHELHHSDTELNVTTSLRTHFLEHTIQALLISLPVIYIFGNEREVFILTPLLTGLLFFSHANLRIHLGSFAKIINAPQLHRIHHSLEEKHKDKNFAQFLPIFDIVFGTYYEPSKHEFPHTGITTNEPKKSIAQNITSPFILWWRMWARKTRT